MKRIQCVVVKMIVALVQFCLAIAAVVGIAYTVMNMVVLATSTPSSSALAVGMTALGLSYLAFCFLDAARISVGEGFAQIKNGTGQEKPFH